MEGKQRGRSAMMRSGDEDGENNFGKNFAKCLKYVSPSIALLITEEASGPATGTPRSDQ